MPPSPASPFAALLRRSKFASFDPTVAQVYTSHGGDLARGNWGLKRPLQLRRKGAYITVGAVDSKEQQTEWNPADQQGRWIQMWDEVGISPVLAEGPWQTRLGPKASTNDGEIETEFSWPKPLKVQRAASIGEDGSDDGLRQGRTVDSSRKGQADDPDIDIETLLRMLEPGPGASMPNIHAMSSKQFEKYLCKIRELRPVFRAYWKLHADAERRDNKESIWQGMPTDHASQFKTFLAKYAQEELTSPTSRVIEQRPQHVGGLTYARSSFLQSLLLTPPRPGRVLGRTRTRGGTQWAGSEFRTSFAGMLSYVDQNWRGDSGEVDWKRLAETGLHDPQQGAAKFRLVGATLRSVPAVVGEKSGFMQNIKLQTHVKAVATEDFGQTARRTPASMEYVGMSDGSITRIIGVKPHPVKRYIKPQASRSPTQIMNSLAALLDNDQSSG